MKNHQLSHTKVIIFCPSMRFFSVVMLRSWYGVAIPTMTWYSLCAHRRDIPCYETCPRCLCSHARMVKELGKKYANVTRDSIELFKSMCIDCQRKRVCPMILVSNDTGKRRACFKSNVLCNSRYLDTGYTEYRGTA